MIFAENILICIAVPVLFSLLFVKGSTRLFLISFITGMVMCLLSGYIDGFISFASEMGQNDASIFISPIVEEIMKILPVLLILFLFVPEDETLLSCAIGIGVGFATFENCCYLLSFGAGSIAFILVRGLAVGVMHIISIVAEAVGLIIVRRFNALSFPSITGALALAMTFHALYNLLVSESGITLYIGYALPIVTALMILLASRRYRNDIIQ